MPFLMIRNDITKVAADAIRYCLNTIRNSWVRDLSPTRHPSAQSGKNRSKLISRSGIIGKGGNSHVRSNLG